MTSRATTTNSAPKGLPPALRVGDHLALDFLNTIAAPRGTSIDWIDSGHDLIAWLVGAGALHASDAQALETAWSASDLDEVAHQAVALREWFRGVIAQVKAMPLQMIEVNRMQLLNHVLAKDTSFKQVAAAAPDGHLQIVFGRHWSHPGEALVPVADSMAELLCVGKLDYVKQCESPACTMWFYDHTKGHRRRWCSQSICGNRAKVAAHRERKKLMP